MVTMSALVEWSFVISRTNCHFLDWLTASFTAVLLAVRVTLAELDSLSFYEFLKTSIVRTQKNQPGISSKHGLFGKSHTDVFLDRRSHRRGEDSGDNLKSL